VSGLTRCQASSPPATSATAQVLACVGGQRNRCRCWEFKLGLWSDFRSARAGQVVDPGIFAVSLGRVAGQRFASSPRRVSAQGPVGTSGIGGAPASGFIVAGGHHRRPHSLELERRAASGRVAGRALSVRGVGLSLASRVRENHRALEQDPDGGDGDRYHRRRVAASQGGQRRARAVGWAAATAVPSAEFDAKSSKFEQERKSASRRTQFTCRPELDNPE
jgi:hypothetical protein